MKHRRLRWAMAAVAHPDKSSLVAKINPYIQNVPSSKNLRALHAAPSSEGEIHVLNVSSVLEVV